MAKLLRRYIVVYSLYQTLYLYKDGEIVKRMPGTHIKEHLTVEISILSRKPVTRINDKNLRDALDRTLKQKHALSKKEDIPNTNKFFVYAYEGWEIEDFILIGD